MAKSIAELLAMETAEPDATLTPLDVFEEKSKDADDAVEYGMGLSEEELLDIVMSVTPMGSVKAGKGAISFLKGLLGRAKSKAKFPFGYGQESVKKMHPSGYDKFSDYTNKLYQEKDLGGILTKLDDPSKKSAIDYIYRKEAIDEWMELQKALGRMSGELKPKGIRQVGKFNRQLQKKNYE